MTSDAMTLRERALGLLSRREHSRLELRRKLAAHTEDGTELETLLDDFEKRGWLSEQRFVEQVIHARNGRYGSRYVVHELREKGVAEALIEQALPQLREGELEAARAVWTKKFGRQPEDMKERARQTRFLQSRGFGLDIIGKLLRGDAD
ncbi:MAG TPA: recombination regulator RecX [Sulfuricella sp.]|nr:recombination regulator RecX [Sulfuricella sp.]